MRYFLRIENGLEKGPYTSGILGPDFDDEERHPTPWEEGLYRRSDGWEAHTPYVCGFASVSQFESWFDWRMLDEIANSNREVATYVKPRNALGLKRIEESTYRVKLFTVPNNAMRTGRKQAVALRARMVEVARMEVSDFLVATAEEVLTANGYAGKLRV